LAAKTFRFGQMFEPRTMDFASRQVLLISDLLVVLNRLVNSGLRIAFQISLNDTTDAFKGYHRRVIDGCQPLISPHFQSDGGITAKSMRGRPRRLQERGQSSIGQKLHAKR
jgi:hypothetical protein